MPTAAKAVQTRLPRYHPVEPSSPRVSPSPGIDVQEETRGPQTAVEHQPLHRRQTAPEEKLAEQVGVATQAHPMLPPVDRQFPYDLLRSVGATEPKRRKVGEEQGERRVVRRPRHEQSDHDRLAEEQQEVLRVCAQDRPLPRQQDRQSRRRSGRWTSLPIRKPLLGDLRPGGQDRRTIRSLVKSVAPLGGSFLRQAVVKQGKLLDPEVLPGLLRRTGKRQPPTRHDEQPVREVDVLDDVRRANRGATAVGEVSQQFHQLELARRIEPAGRFIQEKRRRSGQQFHAHVHPLALAAGEPMDRGVPTRLQAEARGGLQHEFTHLKLRGVGWQAQPGVKL